jgi:hypothetical protein
VGNSSLWSLWLSLLLTTRIDDFLETRDDDCFEMIAHLDGHILP